MRIRSITIENFRSIRTSAVTATAFNVFVGQNNHGKTNLFEAIDWFYSGKGEIDKIRHGRQGLADVAVEIEFDGVADGLDRMKNEKNRAAIKNVLGEQQTVRIRRSSQDLKVRKIFSEAKGDWLEKNPTGFDTALNDFLPKLEYVSTKINPIDYAKYGKNTPIALMLGGVLASILEQNREYLDFRQKFDDLFTSPDSEVRVKLDELSGQVQVQLEKQFPDCTRVVFEVSPPLFDDLLKSFDTSVDDGVYTDAREKGDGMQRALMLAILQTYCAHRRDHGDEAGKVFLFLIDEAELHLHPTAQRNLKNALLEIAHAGDQVLINTHSSVLVVDDAAEQSLYQVEKIDRSTIITPVTAIEKPALVYDLLGGSPSDLLLPRNFFIVEGQSERVFLSAVINRFYAGRSPLQIVPANGDIARVRRSFDAIRVAYTALNESIYAARLVIYVDRQQQRNQIDAFNATFPALAQNGQIREAPMGSLEECYPDPWKRAPAQVNNMSGEQKVQLAREAGAAISQAQFEAGMTDLLNALEHAWDNAFA